MIRYAVTFTLILSSAFTNAAGDFQKCKEVFPNEKVPVVRADSPDKHRALCLGSFAVLYSAESKTPIFVAQRLNKHLLAQAEGEKRAKTFYPEPQLRKFERANLTDYLGSGYDRGHMAPAGDMAGAADMEASFSLANIIPQNKFCNQRPWKKVESDTRKYVKRAQGDVFVFTGVVFEARLKTIGAGKVWVPAYIYKLVYDQSENRAWAHWVKNDRSAKIEKPVSYEELVKRTNINFLPNYR